MFALTPLRARACAQSGAIHPGDLKAALGAALNQILQPVRDHFTNDANARELLKKVKSFKVTR